FLVMPLLAGWTLQDRLKQRGAPPIPEAVRIAREVAEALAAAHALGIMHRDVKPGNIWLEAPHGRVKLLDFGLARAEVGEQRTHSGGVVGTFGYMAPEQGGGKAVLQSDLFSLGCVLYEMLTGAAPFHADNPMGVMANLLMHNPPPPHTVNPRVPPALSA